MPTPTGKQDSQGNIQGSWYLRLDQMEWLRWRKYSEGISQSETLRESLDMLVDRMAQGSAPSRRRKSAH